ncbi:alpha/beta fold hydrolase [Miniphocaeibacter massiliensis]|uniref:alpha/beta fold hydrolase n=1 Tax=Miniphocaeibacter massiliensis TaxID=2041841 RepID=UPI0013EB8223|nr:alpha/beta hydrolase [Miniphocaeibacter massiliensis]
MIVNVNGININYEKYGTGEKSIIFLHGNGETLDIYKDIPKHLKEYTIYMLDTRSHGKSEEVKELYYEDMAEDVAAFLDRLKIQNPILFGFSDGGNSGLILVGKYPNVLSKLIIAGANMYPSGMKNKFLIPIKLAYIFNKSPKVKLMATEPNIKKEFLRKIQVPVIVLAGSKDIVRESHTKKIARNIKNSKLEIIEGESHSSYILNNEKLYNVIKKYL